MTVKLNSLSRWVWLEPKDTIEFRGVAEVERQVRVQFNCEFQTTFYLSQYGVENHLITLPPGVETVEFYAEGDFSIFAMGEGGVAYQCAEHEPTFSEVVDPVIFTKIANRRHRNPELEEILYRSQLNMERRLAQQAGEMEAAFERRVREIEHGRPAETVLSSAPGAVAPAGGAQVPEQKPAGEKSSEAPASGAVSEQQGGGSGGNSGSTTPNSAA